MCCRDQRASRTTAPLTLDALARVEVGPDDIFAGCGEALALAPDTSIAFLVTGARRPFIEIQRALGRFETEVHKVVLIVDAGERVGVKHVAGLTLLTIARARGPAGRARRRADDMSASYRQPARARRARAWSRSGPTFRERDAAAGHAPCVPERPDWVDLGFAAALVAIALVGFRTGFFGWEWIVAAAGGLVLGLVIAHVDRAFRLPAVVTLLGPGGGLLPPRRPAGRAGGPRRRRSSRPGQTFRDLAHTLVHGLEAAADHAAAGRRASAPCWRFPSSWAWSARP